MQYSFSKTFNQRTVDDSVDDRSICGPRREKNVTRRIPSGRRPIHSAHCQRYLFADSAKTTVSRDAVAPPLIISDMTQYYIIITRIFDESATLRP